MSIEISPKSFFEQPSVADMRLISCPGAEELTGLIDKHLVRWAKAAGIDKDTFIIPCDCPRFQSGDAKGLVKESVRGDDIFIVVDPGRLLRQRKVLLFCENQPKFAKWQRIGCLFVENTHSL